LTPSNRCFVFWEIDPSIVPNGFQGRHWESAGVWRYKNIN